MTKVDRYVQKMTSQLGRRIKAARGFAGLSQPALAKALEMSDQTEKRIELGHRPAKRSELLAIAEACQVPMWFLEGGWENYPSSVDDLGRKALTDIDQTDLEKRQREGEQ